MSYFAPIDRQQALAETASRWVGTPFCESSAAVGQGVSCHMLVARILEETEAVPCGTPWPAGSSKGGRKARKLAIEAWIDRWLCPPLAADPPSLDAGDVVTFSFGHIGIILPERKLAHALRNGGVRIDELDDPTWLSCVSRAWRPW